MNILSYKSPTSPDPVSEALSDIFSDCVQAHQWWFMQENTIHCYATNTAEELSICEFPASIVQGHSHYCNEFLWPVFHQLDKFVTFKQADRQKFHQFNAFFAQSILGFDERSVVQPILISGYHLALSPQVMYNYTGFRSTFFWNLPWPKNIDKIYSPFVSEIALGLLHAQVLGFGTPQYAANFLSFVKSALPNFRVDVEGHAVENVHEPDHNTSVQWHPFNCHYSKN